MKYILVFLILLSSSLYSDYDKDFNSYAERRIDAAKKQGADFVNLKVPEKFGADAAIFASACVLQGLYVEVNKSKGHEILTIFWSKEAIQKQKLIVSFVDEYTNILIKEYDECPESTFIYAIWNSENYTGNFYHGCGKVFINALINAQNLTYKDYDYSNMQIVIIFILKEKGFRLERIKKYSHSALFEIQKIQLEEDPDTKVYKKVPF